MSSSTHADHAIEVRELSKKYRILHDGSRRSTFRDVVMDRIRNPFKRTPYEDFWALNDVSFDVPRGEVMGVIGRNGAGKSTLLKILSRVTEPTRGVIDLYGRVGSLLEVGTGFHPELTGRENIYLNGSMLGMRRREIARQFDAIVAFAEVEKFLDTPVKRYSSGMYVRLAFAVAAHLETEILIVDEVLAVGDAAFQDKCIGKIGSVAKGGRTVLFVSHNMTAVRSLCSSCCVMDRGRLVKQGPTEECIAAYLGEFFSGDSLAHVEFPTRPGTRMTSATLLRNGTPGSLLQMGDSIALEVRYRSDHSLRQPCLGFVIMNDRGERLINANNRYQPTLSYTQPHDDRGMLRCDLGPVPLMAGRYLVSLWFGDPGEDTHVAEHALNFEVEEHDVWGTGRVPPRDASLMWWPTRFTVEPERGSPRDN